MNDPACDHVLDVLDGAATDAFGRDLETDLTLLRARLDRLAAAGLPVQESPYLAFARRCTRLGTRSPALAASA